MPFEVGDARCDEKFNSGRIIVGEAEFLDEMLPDSFIDVQATSAETCSKSVYEDLDKREIGICTHSLGFAVLLTAFDHQVIKT